MKKTNPASIKFYLKGLKGLRVLEAIVSEFGTAQIQSVVSAKDSGERVDFFVEIRDFCARNKILFQERITDPKEENVALRIAIGWRWLLPLTPGKLIIIHDSLLPKYRGFSPLVSALMNRDKFLGVTALFAESSFDTGPIIAQEKVKVSYPLKLEEAVEIVSSLYVKILIGIWTRLEKGQVLSAKAQNHKAATYSLWRDEEDYRINWDLSAQEIAHFILVVGSPYKGASSFLNGSLVRILEARALPGVKLENPSVGKVLFVKEGRPIVVCGKGLLEISRMEEDKTEKSLLPLEKFRSRFS
jgi:methionyl-tRNA formyltransferase